MTLEVGELIVCKNAGKNGQCITGRVMGICKDSLNMINSYIMQTSEGSFLQINPHKTCRCNKIGSCNLKRALQGN